MNKTKTIGIIAAMKIEIDALKEKLINPKIITLSGIDYVCGELYNKKVVAAQCGIGKVFAAACAQTMAIKFSPDIIINTGVAGGLNPRLNIADLVIGTKAVQHDMDTSPIGDPVGLISGINVIYFESDNTLVEHVSNISESLNLNYIKGTIASGDQFVSNEETKNKIIELFNADATDMESASTAQICYINKIPFLPLRAISDGANDNANMDYEKFQKLAADNTIKLTDKFIETI